MPIYEYRCQDGHTFEVLQRFSDDPVSTCEVCGAPVERVFHPVAVHFKGSGFYNTDYGTRKRSREKEAASSKEGSSKESSSGDSAKSSDSKSSNGSGADSSPAKKSESKAS